MCKLSLTNKIFCLPELWYNNTKPIISEGWFLEAIEIAHKAVEAASDKQANNIVLLDTRKVCSFADYFVVCSGETDRQIRAISDEVGHRLKKEGILPSHCEGTVGSGWLLLDFDDVIVHIFAALEREYYQLDKLWNQATPVVIMH